MNASIGLRGQADSLTLRHNGPSGRHKRPVVAVIGDRGRAHSTRNRKCDDTIKYAAAKSGMKSVRCVSIIAITAAFILRSQARIDRMTSPAVSVRRSSRPLWGKVSRVWSSPSRCRIVAWRSCTCTRST